MHEQLHKTTRNTGFNNSLDLIIGPVGEVGDSPTSINENFVVKRINQLGENRKCGKNLLGL